MPLFPIHHQGHIFGKPQFSDTLLRFFINVSLDLLAGHIGITKLAGQALRLFRRLGDHELHAFFGVGNTARCIEPWRQAKGNLVCMGDGFRILMHEPRRHEKGR